MPLYCAGCSGADLVVGGNTTCPAPVGYMCLVAEDGVSEVIYNKTVAMYRVISSSHYIEGNVMRRCMSDGNWDGMIPSFPSLLRGKYMYTYMYMHGTVCVLVLLYTPHDFGQSVREL